MIASVLLGDPSSPVGNWEGWQSIGAAVNQWVLNARVRAGGPSDTVLEYDPTPVAIADDGRLLSVATVLTALVAAAFLGRLCWVFNHKILPELRAIRRNTAEPVEPDTAALVGVTASGES